jgi:hypothetical protein
MEHHGSRNEIANNRSGVKVMQRYLLSVKGHVKKIVSKLIAKKWCIGTLENIFEVNIL